MAVECQTKSVYTAFMFLQALLKTFNSIVHFWFSKFVHFMHSDQFNFRPTAGSRFRMPQIKAKPNLDILKVSGFELYFCFAVSLAQSIYLWILISVYAFADECSVSKH